MHGLWEELFAVGGRVMISLTEGHLTMSLAILRVVTEALRSTPPPTTFTVAMPLLSVQSKVTHLTTPINMTFPYRSPVGIAVIGSKIIL